MFNGQMHYKWSFSIALSVITRGYVVITWIFPHFNRNIIQNIWWCSESMLIYYRVSSLYSSGRWFQPHWKILVNWHDSSQSQYMEKNVPNHQPVMIHEFMTHQLPTPRGIHMEKCCCRRSAASSTAHGLDQINVSSIYRKLPCTFW